MKRWWVLLFCVINKLEIIEKELSMKQLKRMVCYLVGGLICFGQAIAATNPISWALDQAFPNTVTAGTTYSATYTLTNKLPMQLVNPLVIKHNASPDSEFTYTDGCTGQRLMPNRTCNITIYLLPVAAGEKPRAFHE